MEIIDGVEQGSGAVAAITSGTINGAIIGGSTAAAGTFTTLSADSIADLDSIALFDSNDSHSLTITWDENDTSNRTLKLKVSTGNRVLTMTGDATIADWFDQAVKAASSPTFAVVSVNNSGIHIADTNASHDLILACGSDLDTTDKTLTLTTGNSNRTITLSGDPTLSDWFDQAVKATSSPTFAGVTLNNTGLHLLDTNASHDLIIKPGSDLTADKTLTLTTGDADRTITLNGNPTLNDWFDQGVKVADSPEFAAITETGGVLKQNLLTNSGFEFWSNSTLAQGRTVGQQSNSFDSGSAILDNDGTAIASWNTTTTRCTVTVGAGIFTITDDGTGTTMETSVDLSGLTIGALYKFAVKVTNGTGTWAVGAGAGIQVEPNGGGTNLAYVASQTEASERDYSVIWRATETNNRITIVADVAASQTVTYDDVYVIEVIPGCVSADTLALDGWFKKSGIEVLRQHNDGGTLTKDGSFYSLKINSITAGDNVIWPLSAIKTEAYHYQKFAGRKITFGAWVYATTASHAFLQLVDSDTTDDDQSSDSSSYHTGGSSWEWLEVTMTVSASTTEFSVALCFDNTTTAYISQPMLVFGNSIGEGNYSLNPDKWITFDKLITFVTFGSTAVISHNDVASTTLVNIEVETLGKIGKGVEVYTVSGHTRDVASSTNSTELHFNKLSGKNVAQSTWGSRCGGLANDFWNAFIGPVRANSEGNFYYGLEASGGNTFDTIGFFISAVKLR